MQLVWLFDFKKNGKRRTLTKSVTQKQGQNKSQINQQNSAYVKIDLNLIQLVKEISS